MAFCSHSGLYEFNVMPFGLCNALAMFQRLMEAVLVGLAREKHIVYLGDILVRTFQEHLDNLTQVLTKSWIKAEAREVSPGEEGGMLLRLCSFSERS